MKRQTIMAKGVAIDIGPPMNSEWVNDYRLIDKLLLEGWVLDSTLTSGKPYVLDAVTVWPLVFYESEDEKPKAIEEVKLSEFSDVEDMKDVPNAEVSDLLKQGYQIQTIYQKNCIMLKRKQKEAPKPVGVA